MNQIFLSSQKWAHQILRTKLFVSTFSVSTIKLGVLNWANKVKRTTHLNVIRILTRPQN